MGRVTIKDVANDAGVSITTASFAINNRTGRISEAAKEKVFASAEKLGYVPNINARNLRTKTSNTYMLVYDERYLLERNASTLQFVVGAVKYSARREKDLLLRTVPRITNGVQAAEEFGMQSMRTVLFFKSVKKTKARRIGFMSTCLTKKLTLW